MKPKLGEILVKAGVIDVVQLRAALSEQKKWGGRLGNILLQMRMLTEDALVRALSKQLNIPRFKFKDESISDAALSLVDPDTCEKYSLLPVAVNTEKKVLLVAMADPTNFQAVDEIQFSTGFRVQVAVCGPTEVAKAIRKYHYGDSLFGRMKDDLQAGAMNYTAFGDFSQENLIEEGISKPIVRIKSRANMPKVTGDSPANAFQEQPVYDERIQKLEDRLRKVMQAQKELINLLIEKKIIGKKELMDKLKKG